MRIQTILVPVDFSAASRQAFDYAVSLAKAEGGAVRALHALHLPPDLRMTGDWWATSRAAAMRGLREFEETGQAAGVSVETEITNDSPVEAVVRLAEERDVDLIVIGSRGHGGLRHLLLGNTVKQVLALAPCPVLTTVESSTRRAGDPPSIERILVPIDFSKSAEAAFHWAADFAASHAARLHLINAQHIDVAIPGVAMPPVLTEEIRLSIRERLEFQASGLRERGIEVTTDVVADSPAGAIRDAAKQFEADLIVMGTRGQSGFAHVLLGSVAERTIHLASCPVLTVRAKD